MPRSRTCKTPKKKPTVDAGKVDKPPKRRSPRKRAAKVAAVNPKPGPKFEAERCQEWLRSQATKTGEYDTIDDIDMDGNLKSSSVPETIVEEEMPPPAADPKSKIQINLICEWMRCNRVFTSFLALREHVLDSHLSSPCATQSDGLFECHWDLCHFNTDVELDFRRHVLHHLFHSNLKSIGEGLLLRKTVPPCVVEFRRRNTIDDCPVDWTCNWENCTKSFDQMFDFIDHVRAHVRFLASLRRPFESAEERMLHCGWKGCDKKYYLCIHLTQHVRSHTNERMMACPNCGSTFTSYSKFYAHFNRQGEDKKYQCVHCFKYFFNEELLTNHMYIHVNCYKCTMCDMTCPSPSGLATHMRIRHITDKPFKCELCSFTSTKKHDLERHLLAKHEQNVYECDEFGCSFSTESLFMMRKHDREVHLGLVRNVYGCHCCPRRYSRGNHLSQHLIKTHQFQLPSGHSRFTYSPDMEGIFRLQTMRMESLEVTQAIMSPSRSDTVTRQPTNFDQKPPTFNLSVIEESTLTPGAINISITNPDPKPTSCGVVSGLGSSSSTDDDDKDQPSANRGHSSMPELRCSAGDESTNDDGAFEELCTQRTTSLRKSTLRRRATQQMQMSPFKNIQDFSVMQRYLRQEHATNKKIVIEVTKLDESGVVIQSNTMRADEFYIESDEIQAL